MGVKISHRGSFSKLDQFLKNYDRQKLILILEQLGKEGVEALSLATPKDSGETATSWSYKVRVRGGSGGRISLEWYNSNVNKGVPIAIILQYGHATGTGGYVQGIDYINPAIKPIFDRISIALWEEVKNL